MYSTDYKALLRKSYRNKGLSLLLSSNPEEAIIYLDKALSLDPNDYKAIMHKANAYSSMELHKKAITLYDKIIDALEADWGK